jgi:hypothetical protein
MAEYTYIPDTEHVYPNLTIKKVLRDGVLVYYDLTSNDGYVMYRTNANDMEMDENGEWHPVIYYYTHAILQPRTNFETQFTWVAVLRSTVDEDMIFGNTDKPEIM